MTEQALTKDERAAAIDELVGEIMDASAPDDEPVTGVAVISEKQADAVRKWADTSAGGKPLATMMNAMICIQRLGLECRLDIFRNRYTVNGSSLETYVGDLSDAISRKIREQSRVRFGLDPGKECTSDALKRMCEARRFHPFQDYLYGLKWDGKKRTNTWMTDYLGVEDTPLVREQGAIVIAAIVKRAFQPGCKFDHVLVLEGPEGGTKSSVCRVLANGTFDGNDFFSDSPILHADERKQQELIAGIIVYELAELAGMRKGDQHMIKNFVTKQVERARAAYAEFNDNVDRSCIFIGTFNTDADTGAVIEYLNVGDRRRWWPVSVGKIDTDGLIAARDQLFAEAMAEYEMFGGRNLYLTPDLEDAARAIAKSREKTDMLSDTFSTIYAEVVRLAKGSVAGVNEAMVTTDSKVVTKKSVAFGVALTKGEEAEPFAAYNRKSGDAWVSAKYVAELVPSGRKADSSSPASAMRANGWKPVNDRTSGSKIRGWFKPAPSIDE
jgi:predicted P-loop ATPase